VADERHVPPLLAGARSGVREGGDGGRTRRAQGPSVRGRHPRLALQRAAPRLRGGARRLHARVPAAARLVRRVLPIASLLLAMPSAAAADSADLVLRGGSVWAGKGLPAATAIAIRGERVVAVGTDESVRALVGPKTRVVELAGRFVVPGFNDAHVHLLSGGFGLLSVDLRDAKDEAEFVRRIGEPAK